MDPIRDQMLREMDSQEIGHRPDPIRDAMLKDMEAEEYSTYPQQALSMVEGAGRGLLGPLFTAGEKALYEAGAEQLSPEHQQKRREENPLKSELAEFGTLAFGLGKGFGLGGALAKAGTRTQEALEGANTAKRIIEAGGVAHTVVPPSPVVKVGSKLAAAFVENGLYQTQNEIQNLINDRPNSVETALTNVGMMGALGGAIGGGGMAVSALWKKTAGLKVARNLKTIANRLGGIEGDYFNPTKEVIERSGMDIDPVIKAGLIEDPEVQNTVSHLIQTDTSNAGILTQEKYRNNLDSVGKMMSEELGHEPAKLADKYDELTEARHYANSIDNKVNAIVNPKVKLYDDLKEKWFDHSLFENHSNENGVLNDIRDNLATLKQENHWDEVKSSLILKEVNKVQSELSHSRTIAGLENLIQTVNADIRKARKDLDFKFGYDAGKIIRILEDGQGEVIKRYELERLGIGSEKAIHFQNEFNIARKQYAEAAEMIRPLKERLGLEASSVAGFSKNLRQMAKEDPEKILRALSGKGDASLFEELGKNFPEALQALRETRIKEILINSKIYQSDRIDPKKLLREIKNLSPQEEALILGPLKDKFDAIQKVFTGLDQGVFKNYNSSNTARRTQKNNQYEWATVFGMASFLLGGHAPIDSVIEGLFLNAAKREIPDAVRYQYLKWLGSNKEISAPGFKAMGEFIKQVKTGEQKINTAIDAVFKSGTKVLTTPKPDEKELKKLDQKFKELGQNPMKLEEVGTLTSHYMPEHGQAAQIMVGNVAAYVNDQRPKPTKLGPLDPDLEPPMSEQYAFTRLLQMAEQPLVVFDNLKEGTLTDKDVGHFVSMYPSLYNSTKVKLIDELSGVLSEGKKISHATKQGLSTFFGMPLEFSFSPQMLVSNQMASAVSQNAKEQGQTPKVKQSGMMKLKRDKRLSLESQDTA